MRMEVHPDDGSKAWTESYERALQGPCATSDERSHIG